MKAKYEHFLVLVWLGAVGRAHARRRRELPMEIPALSSKHVFELPQSVTRIHRTNRMQALAASLLAMKPTSRRFHHPAISMDTAELHAFGSQRVGASRISTVRLKMRAADRSKRASAKTFHRTTMRALPQNQGSVDSSSSRRQAIAGGLAAAMLIVPRVAEAAYGSARGAVTSPPELRDFSVENFEKLDPRKQVQVESILKKTQVEELLQGLSSEKEALESRIGFATQTRQDRLAKYKELQKEKKIVSREVRRIKAAIVELQKETAMLREKANDLKSELDMAQFSKTGKASKAKSQLSAMYAESLREEKKLLDLEKTVSKELDSSQKELEKFDEIEQAQRNLIQESVAEEEALKNARDELERNLKLQEQVKKREEIVEALDAQPDWFNYVAAFFASCVSTLIMHPVDTLKTRQILANAKVDVEPDSSSVITDSSGTDDPSLILASNDTILSEEPADFDILSLYQGLPGALLKEGPPSALYLGIYEAVKTFLLTFPFFEANPLFAYLIAGGVGETGGSVLRAPAEQLKTRVQSGMDASIGESIQRVLFEESGRQNAVRSWSASVWRDVPFGGIQLAVFETLKSIIINSPQSFLDIDINALSTEILLGALGGATGAFVSTPMDVVTTRIMTQEGDSNKLGFAGMTKKLWAEGGWSAIWKGALTRTGYWAPAIGIFLSCYCSIRQAAVAQDVFPLGP